MPVRRAVVAALFAGGAAVSGLAVVEPSRGAPAAAQAAPRLELARQDAWVPTRGDFTMLLRTSGPTDGLRLTLTVHDRVVSRSAFDATLARENPAFPQTLTLLRLSLDDFPETFGGARVVTLGLGQLGIRRSGNGVYPIEVQLRDGDDVTVAGFVTHVVVVDLAAGRPLPLKVAWVWPLSAPPALAFDNTVDPHVLAALSPTGRLGRQAAAVGADTTVPLTLAPNPETLEAWSALAQTHLDLAAGVAALRSAPARHQVLAGPYVAVDLPALAASGLGHLVVAELERGWDSLRRFFDTHIDPSTAFAGPLDAASLDALRAAARTRLVVRGTALEPYTGRFSPTRPALLAAGAAPATGEGPITVVATDAGLERFLQGDDAPGLRAAHLLASLAVTAGEEPSLPRGVTFANPADWEPAEEFVAAVMAGLADHPLLRPVTVDTLLAETPLERTGGAPDGEHLVRVLAPAPVARAPLTAREHAEALRSRQGIAELFGEDDPRVVAADRVLLSMLAADLQTPQGRRYARSQLAAIGRSGQDFLSLVRVPLESTITLTASRAEIPLTFRNDADRSVPIHLTLRSSKLLFPDGAARDIVLEPGKNLTVRIAVETRTSGSFPLVMTVTTPGGLPIQRSEVMVRSSFVSGVGVFITVSAVLFLAGWWALDIRSRRRRAAA